MDFKKIASKALAPEARGLGGKVAGVGKIIRRVGCLGVLAVIAVVIIIIYLGIKTTGAIKGVMANSATVAVTFNADHSAITMTDYIFTNSSDRMTTISPSEPLPDALAPVADWAFEAFEAAWPDKNFIWWDGKSDPPDANLVMRIKIKSSYKVVDDLKIRESYDAWTAELVALDNDKKNASMDPQRKLARKRNIRKKASTTVFERRYKLQTNVGIVYGQLSEDKTKYSSLGLVLSTITELGDYQESLDGSYDWPQELGLLISTFPPENHIGGLEEAITRGAKRIAASMAK